MCLGIPGEVTAVDGEWAVVNINGVEYRAGLQLVDNVRPGDWVILHAGYVLEKLDAAQAKETLTLIADVCKKP